MESTAGTEGGAAVAAAHPHGTSRPRRATGPCALEYEVEKKAEAVAKEAGHTAAAVCPRGSNRTRAPGASGPCSEAKEAGSAAMAARPPWSFRPHGKTKESGSTAAVAHPRESSRTRGTSGQYALDHKAETRVGVGAGVGEEGGVGVVVGAEGGAEGGGEGGAEGGAKDWVDGGAKETARLAGKEI